VKSGRNWLWHHISRRVRPKPEPDSEMAAALLCVMMMCIKSCINCSVLMSVISLVFLLHVVMHNICLFECTLMLTNDSKLNRFHDIHALLLLY